MRWFVVTIANRHNVDLLAQIGHYSHIGVIKIETQERLIDDGGASKIEAILTQQQVQKLHIDFVGQTMSSDHDYFMLLWLNVHVLYDMSDNGIDAFDVKVELSKYYINKYDKN